MKQMMVEIINNILIKDYWEAQEKRFKVVKNQQTIW